MKRLVLLPVLLLLISGCFHKSVKTDEADDIVKARIYSDNGSSYLVMLESIYQATYKESRQGITFISGYNDLRISVYDMKDGSLVARKPTGKQNRNPIVFLGCTPANLWFYSREDKLHSLDPTTLEIKITQDDIVAKNPELKDNFAECEGYQYEQFFQFNDISRKIVLTDKVGFRYLLNSETLKAEKLEGEYLSFDPQEDRNLITSISQPEPGMNMSGDLRKQIRIEGKEVNPSLTFLEGQMIADRNAWNVYEGLQDQLSGCMKQAEKLYPRIMAFNALNNGNGPRWGTPERDTLRKMEDEKYRLERYIKNLEESYSDITSRGYSNRYTPLLSSDTNTFYIFHKANTTKEGRVIISRIQREGNSQLTELWRTMIDGLFFDPNAASETNDFKRVFSKGDPEFRFSYFDIGDGKLVIVWMLHAYCLDINDGHVIWHFRV